MSESYRIAVVGATGAVGKELLHCLEKRKFPVQEVRRISSENISEEVFAKIDLAFFCAGAPVSKIYAPIAIEKGAIVIDSSSAFRMDPKIPLVIPEINAHTLLQHNGLIAKPNCVVTVLLLPLFLLHRRWQIKRIVCATYQAASGGGAKLMEELTCETRAVLAGEPGRSRFPFPYAFNLFLHDAPDEEVKVAQETRKILDAQEIAISATCVRVPVLRSHAISANIEFHEEANLEEAKALLRHTPGVQFFEERTATPFDATGRDEVLCSRLRRDADHPRTLELWIVGDQLLKGAALNAVQIAEALIAKTL